MQKIAVFNQKGGTAKTTTTVNLGVALVKMGYKVLLVDLDAQAALTYYFGLQGIKNTISNVILDKIPLEGAVYRAEGVDILPANMDLTNTELSISHAAHRLQILQEIFQTDLSYDYMLIDCPPVLSLLTVNALNISDYVLIPSQLEVLSLHSISLVEESIQKMKNGLNPSLKVLGILPVMVDKRKKISEEVLNFIQNNYKYPILKTHIRTCVKAIEAPSFALSLINYAPNSHSSQDYLTLAKEIRGYISQST